MDPGGHAPHFAFIGGPYDGETLPVADQGDGYPEIFVVPWTDESLEGLSIDDPPPEISEHRYERDGSAYRYLSKAEPGQ